MHGKTHHAVEVVTQNGLQSVSVWSQGRLPSNQSARTVQSTVSDTLTRVGGFSSRCSRPMWKEYCIRQLSLSR